MDLTAYAEKIKERKPLKGIHTALHAITLEVIEWTGEKNFGLWLGTIKRIGEPRMRGYLAEVKRRKIKDPKYLLAMTKKKH